MFVTWPIHSIGYAIAKKLGQNGAHVVVSSRKDTNVQMATAQLKDMNISAIGVVCHVSKEDQRKDLINKAVEKFGGIDILVSNAGINPMAGGILECSSEIWDKIFEVNVKNALQLTQLAVPYIEKRNGGSIIYISSIVGYQPMPFLGAYSVSKTALLGLTKAVAQEVAAKNIRVNCVCPGIIKTKLSRAIYENEAVQSRVLEQVPLGRLGITDDISGLVSFLCSDEASYITGESFVAAGGMQSRL